MGRHKQPSAHQVGMSNQNNAVSIAARIAAEHRWTGEETRDGKRCSCDTYTKQHVLHVAEVTERAVRAQVAADIEVKRAEAALAATAYREAGDESAAWEAAMSAHAYGYAARIAEEGPRP